MVYRTMACMAAFFSLIVFQAMTLGLQAEETAAVKKAADILIDAVHANDYSDFGLQPDLYDYHRTCGFRRGFEFLGHCGVRIARHETRLLTGEKLRSHRLLFINLVSGERPPFLVSEVNAIVQFIREGGSLLLVTEHSNTYYHMHRLLPLLAELDIEGFLDTACDVSPHTLGSGNGWVAVESFREHPVTAGLRRIALQTGGCVDPRFAVAFTSEKSWADAWVTSEYGESNAPGFFGNFQRDPGERGGPLGVVMAKEFGQGRIVVVADQNFFSDTFINYADNYRLWLNTISWLLRDEHLNDPAAYRRFLPRRVLLLEDFELATFGSDDRFGCVNLMGFLSRYYWVFADNRSATEPDGRAVDDLIVLPNGHFELTPDILKVAVDHLRGGGPVLFLHTFPGAVADTSSGVYQTLRAAGLDDPATATLSQIDDIRSTLTLPDGGSVTLFRPRFSLYNNAIPDPGRKPNAEQSRVYESLKKNIDDLLPPLSSAP